MYGPVTVRIGTTSVSLASKRRQMLLFFYRAVTVRNGCDAKGRNLKGLDRSESKLAVNKEVKRHGNSRATTREGSYVKQVRPAEHR